MISLSNNEVTLLISEHGAELHSIKADGQEYLWQADPKFWNRHSPVLFPMVGRVWNNEYRHGGRTYSMGQHGFARDMDFTLVLLNDHEATFRLQSSEETLTRYPFAFCLEVSYVLRGRHIAVVWTVRNTGTETMHFQIGAHPAFLYRDFDASTGLRAYLDFGPHVRSLTYISPTEKGCTPCEPHTLTIEGGEMEINTSTFACDTYIFDHSQLNAITLKDRQHRPYLMMNFQTPLVAVWSPSATKPDVPFICLEPWYGRCDRVGYSGELADRDCMNHLLPGRVFCEGYSITLL